MQLEDILPHRSPLLLLSEVIEVSSEKLLSRVNITDESLFFSGLLVPNYVSIEYMAQTVGLFMGLEVGNHQKKPKVGFLIGVRQFECSIDGFRNGDNLIIEADPLLVEDPVGNFKCRVILNDNCVASARLTVYRPTQGELKKMGNSLMEKK